MANALGVPLQTLLDSGTLSASAKGKKGPRRYVDPTNTAHVWSGAGRRPDWLKAALASGASLDKFRV